MPQQPGILEQLAAIYRDAIAAGLRAIPSLVAGAAVIVIMMLAAKLVERVLRALLVRLRFDVLLHQAGIDRTLHRIGLRESINIVLPRLVYFLLLCLIARIGADLLRLQAVSQAFDAFFRYMPNIVAAVLLLVVGSAASQFAGETVAEAAREAHIEFARSLGGLVSALILFVIGIMALAQLQIDTEIIRVVATCALGGIALAFGLSFGLGTRAITRDIVDYDFDVVASVGNGRVAVDAAVQFMPDIVVLDVSMPMLDGLEVAMRLKAQRCSAKVIFLTASNDPDHVEACLAAGGDACVWEPRAGTDLVHAIKEVLAGRLFFDVTPNRDGVLN